MNGKAEDDMGGNIIWNRAKGRGKEVFFCWNFLYFKVFVIFIYEVIILGFIE